MQVTVPAAHHRSEPRGSARPSAAALASFVRPSPHDP